MAMTMLYQLSLISHLSGKGKILHNSIKTHPASFGILNAALPGEKITEMLKLQTDEKNVSNHSGRR